MRLEQKESVIGVAGGSGSGSGSGSVFVGAFLGYGRCNRISCLLFGRNWI